MHTYRISYWYPDGAPIECDARNLNDTTRIPELLMFGGCFHSESSLAIYLNSELR